MQLALVSAILAGGSLTACDEGGLKGAKAEVQETSIKLDLPDVPAFDMPGPHADGNHSVREMRLKGRKLFGTEVAMRGYVTWIYDCLSANRKPGMTDKQVAKKIGDDPSLCTIPHFYIGDSAETAPDKSAWIVEVPRELRKDERRRLTREELAALPPVPKFEIGDEVIVKGTWDHRSPRGFSNSNGLLVYKEFQNITATAGAEQ